MKPKYAAILLAPSVIVLLVLALVPTVALVVLALVDWTQYTAPSFAGVANFRMIWSDVSFWSSLRFTLLFVCVATFLEVVVGTVIAIQLECWPRFRAQLRALFSIPLVLSPVLVAIVWRAALNERSGLFTLVLRPILGDTWRPLSSQWGAVSTLIAIDIWQWTPLVIIMASLALEASKRRFGDLAHVDGMGAFTGNRRIWIPLAIPALSIASILRAVDCLRVFEIAQVATAGGPGSATESLSLYTYRQLIKFGNFGYSASLAFVLVAMASAFFLIGSRWFARGYRT